MPRARYLIAACALTVFAGAGLASPASAQAPSRSRVETSPSGDTQALNAALGRLAHNPRDPDALIDAGTAALALGDADAAIGFFNRAQQVDPTSARAKAGLAGAYVRNEDPFTAIRLFDEAERSGRLTSDLLADRGLAYDLVGDNATAQRYYRLAGSGNEEALRRLSLSLAIAGDRRGSEAALAPLLSRQDKSAWRVRAFDLAILGETAQAVSIANAMMPASMAAGIAPYLRYMRQLTPAQQAAAANLGHFPRASEIGHDDPRIAQYSRPVTRLAAGGPDAGLIPRGEPLGKREAQRQAKQERDRERERNRQASRERERPPEPIVTTTTAAPSPVLALNRPVPRPQATTPAQVPTRAILTPVPSMPAPVRSEPPAPAAPVHVAASTGSHGNVPRPIQGPSFDLLGSPVSSVAPSAVPAAARPAASPRSLADAFSDFGRPTISTVPAPGAVDVRKLAKPASPKVVKPAVPAQPSRIWVQVATGRDKRALAFDWRKMTRENAKIFRGRKPHVAAWGLTNRLLTGPFETEAAAGEFITKLHKEDIAGAFLWTSPAGQVVDDLSVGK